MVPPRRLAWWLNVNLEGVSAVLDSCHPRTVLRVRKSVCCIADASQWLPRRSPLTEVGSTVCLGLENHFLFVWMGREEKGRRLVFVTPSPLYLILQLPDASPLLLLFFSVPSLKNVPVWSCHFFTSPDTILVRHGNIGCHWDMWIWQGRVCMPASAGVNSDRELSLSVAGHALRRSELFYHSIY